MIIKDLFEKYKIDYQDITSNILEIELGEELKNFKNGYKNKDIYNFTGEHKIDNNLLVKIQVLINLTNIKQVDYLLINNPKESELSLNDARDRIIELAEYEAVTYTYSSNNFNGLETYNIMGGLIRQA